MVKNYEATDDPFDNHRLWFIWQSIDPSTWRDFDEVFAVIRWPSGVAVPLECQNLIDAIDEAADHLLGSGASGVSVVGVTGGEVILTWQFIAAKGSRLCLILVQN